jgi:tetrahydromethanopterin S-methyltransferase subunit G
LHDLILFSRHKNIKNLVVIRLSNFFLTTNYTIEGQIRSRARNLPIDRCFVSSDWDESKSANVIISRKHANGKITFGLYLVDLLLLGVTDCSYAFNEAPSELENLLDDIDDKLEECEYELVHNIIYESVAFALENGFDPVKTFTKTGEYILEKDIDDFPQIDIPLGSLGVPVVVVSPDNDRKREIAILEKTIGNDNFIICHVDEDGNVLDDGDDKDDEKLLKLIMNDKRFNSVLQRLPELEKYTDQLQSIIDKTVDDIDAALEELKALIAAHPDDVYLGISYIMMLNDMDKKDGL